MPPLLSLMNDKKTIKAYGFAHDPWAGIYLHSLICVMRLKPMCEYLQTLFGEREPNKMSFNSSGLDWSRLKIADMSHSLPRNWDHNSRNNCVTMLVFMLSKDAKEDPQTHLPLWRIDLRWGKVDRYYDALFERFEEIDNEPYWYQSVDSIRSGYRHSVCGVDNIFYLLSVDETVEIIAIVRTQDYPERL